MEHVWLGFIYLFFQPPLYHIFYWFSAVRVRVSDSGGVGGRIVVSRLHSKQVPVQYCRITNIAHDVRGRIFHSRKKNQKRTQGTAHAGNCIPG